MSQYQQFTFIDGLDFLANDTQISPNGYYYLINARNREGYLEANKKHRQITNAPPGLKQGCISIGNVLILFVAGQAFYQIDSTTNWALVPGFSMSISVLKYFSIAVPDSTFNFTRKLNPTANIQSPLVVIAGTSIQGSLAAILVQDGVNQPWVIFYNAITQSFTSRVTQTYAQWQNDTTHREYVPIGMNMMLMNQKLYIVSPSKTAIYQSISGRPLDFMVNIDINGNKLPSETQGGAASVAFSFDSDEITCIREINIPNSFILGTKFNVRIIQQDQQNTIFGEPTYFQTAIIKAGIVNQDCLVEILGDYAFIDFEGVKSFNAVLQLRYEGRNSIFSLQLSRLLKGIKQTTPVVIDFNNYAIFSVNTKWGYMYIVYDTILQKWVALDITTSARVKQSTVVETVTESKLYVITEDNKLYQLYAHDELETAQVHLRSFVADGQVGNQSSEYLRTQFQDGSSDTTVEVQEFSDGQFSKRATLELKDHRAAVGPGPVYFPVIPSTRPRSEILTFGLTRGIKGRKLTYVIKWANDAKLQSIELLTADQIENTTSKEQKERTYANS